MFSLVKAVCSFDCSQTIAINIVDEDTHIYYTRAKEKVCILSLLRFRSDNFSVMKRTHSALFMGAYAVLYLNWSASYTVQKLTHDIGENFSYFCDYNGSYDYKLCIHDCLEGIKVGVLEHGWFTLDGVNPLKYGLNMSWVIPNKIIAMKDPKMAQLQGTVGLSRKYVTELLRNKTDFVVRLNGKDFERDEKYGKPYPLEEFFAEGIAVCDIPITDGGVPTAKQLDLFLEVCSIPESLTAVHCHAGMGRTGTMIACYLIRNYGFTSRQAVAWLNLCRRGSVMGRQHGFLDDYYDELSKKVRDDGVRSLGQKDEELAGENSVMEEEEKAEQQNDELEKGERDEEFEPKAKRGRLEELVLENE